MSVHSASGDDIRDRVPPVPDIVGTGNTFGEGGNENAQITMQTSNFEPAAHTEGGYDAALRPRRNTMLTERGLAYQQEKERIRLKQFHNRLNNQIVVIQTLMSSYGNLEKMNHEVLSFDKVSSGLIESYTVYTSYIVEEDAQVTATKQMDDADKKIFEVKAEVYAWINKAREYWESRSTSSVDTEGSIHSGGSRRSKTSRKSKDSNNSRHSSYKSGASKHTQYSMAESLKDQEAIIAGLKAEKNSIEERRAAETKVEVMRVEQEIKKAEAIATVYAKKVSESASIRKRKGRDVRERKKDKKSSIKKHSEVSLLSESMHQLMKLQSAPDVEIEVFSGDYLEYNYFMSTFKEVVEDKVEDPMGRLTRLLKFTSGEAKDLIKHCVQEDANTCYEQAKALLDQQFGNPYRVASVYVKELKQWPQLRAGDSAGFRKFYRFLLKCKSCMDNSSYLRQLDAPEVLRSLQCKLPFTLQERWNRKAESIRRKRCREATFMDFTEMIEIETRLVNDPMYSREALNEMKEGRSIIGPKVSSHTVTVGEKSCPTGVESCPCCDNKHDLDDCTEYLGKRLFERNKFLFEKRLCFACYKSINPGHQARTCTERRTCKVCKGPHPTGLHGRIPTVKGLVTVSHSASQHNSIISMTVVPVLLRHRRSPGKEVLVYAMLDNCSQGTFVEEDVLEIFSDADDMRRTVITVKTLTGQSTESSTAVEGLLVSPANAFAKRYALPEPIELPVTYSRTKLPIDLEDIPTPEKLSSWKHLSQVVKEIPGYNKDIPFGLLIGGDCPKALEPQQVFPSCEGGPYAFRSLLGWCVVGPMQGPARPMRATTVNRVRVSVRDVTSDKLADHHFIVENKVEDSSIKKMLNHMYHSDFNENQGEKDAMSYEDRMFIDIMNRGITIADGHYQLPLPFRSSEVSMYNNKEQTINRAESIKRRLVRNSKLYDDYKVFMETLLEKGYARKVDTNNNSIQEGAAWYIPHHAVYHKKKPEKVRVVFDCSASYSGKSLNTELLQGPDLTNKLIGVLIRFRKESVAFMADIEAMYYQVRVPESQRNFLRFLWWPDGDLSSDLCEYEMCVHLFGAISSPSCANFALRRTAIDNEYEFGKEAKDTLFDNFYVDDLLKSVSDSESAIKLGSSVRSMCSAGGFHLTKFTANDADFMASIPEEERAQQVKDYELISCIPPERALGVHWCVENDSLGFRISLQNKPLTRRGILSIVSSIYDPLGLVSPFLLPGRKILQEISADHAGWDEKVAEEHRIRWEHWIKDLPQLEKLNISRCYKPHDFGESVETTIHSFSDGSTIGYGQASYLRQVNVKGDVHVSLVMGKSRVAPLKPITIPRLELTAATVSVKVGAVLNNELGIDNAQYIYWTDSKIVLGYISNDTRRFRVYVANRVQMIRSNTDKAQWRYVSSDENPGDFASRGLQFNSENVDMWFKGPDFLWKRNDVWKFGEVLPEVEESDPEIIIKVKTVNTSTVTVEKHIFSSLQEKISCWHRLKRVIAIMKAFAVKCRNKSCTTKQVGKCVELTVGQIQEAENLIVRWVQGEHFSKEIATLKRIASESTDRVSLRDRKKMLRGGSIYNLDPFLDDNSVLRVGGRLKKSSLEINTKFPILLPKNSKITKLIIRWFHNLVEHGGRHMTLNEVRASGYWVVHGSSLVQQYVNKCVRCRFLRGRLGMQKMASLPVERSIPEAPFVYSGVDAFGPFIVKEGRREMKRYGVLFTCFCSRAVHIEKVNNMDTDSFIQALRRFLSRRGYVRSIRSDNGSNFIGAESEMKKAYDEMNHVKIKDYLLTQACDWILWEKNPPYASHMGGVWERQIRTVRSILSSILKNHTSILDDECLHTFLTEAESIINSRPLTTDNLNDPNSVEPVTPNHILTMKSKVVSAPPGVFQKADLYCRRRWRRVQYLLNIFWSVWRKDYLNSLQKRQKWNAEKRNFCKGDVVLLKDDSFRRNCWPMGRVVETFPDDEGLVRHVDLKTADSGILRRPIAKLVLLLESSEE